MSSKILIVLVVGAVMLSGVGCSTQTELPTELQITTQAEPLPIVPLHEALKLAEEQRQQGKFDEAFKTLAAIKPVVSESSPLSSLESSYEGKIDVLANEFYLKDRELVKLVETLLKNRRSDGAVIVAQRIANHELRNNVLLDILKCQYQAANRKPGEFELMIGKAEKTALLLTDDIVAQRIANHELRNNILLDILKLQCQAASRNPEEFDMLIGKAEKTALLLTDRFRIEGDRFLAVFFKSIRKFDLSLEAAKKLENAGLREACFKQVAYSVHLFEKTPENEELLQKVCNLVQEPSNKVEMLLTLAKFYGSRPVVPPGTVTIDEADSKTKRLKVLHEATELLLSFPDAGHNVSGLLEIQEFHRIDGHEDEAAAIQKAISESILNITDENKLFTWLRYHYHPNYSFRTVESLDTNLIERVRLIAAKTDDPELRAERYNILLTVVRRWPTSGSEERKKVFQEACQAALEITDTTRGQRLLALIGDRADQEEIRILLHDAAEALLAFGGEKTHEKDNRRQWMQAIFLRFVKQDNVDWMLELVHSPRIPDAWKQDLYLAAVDCLLDLNRHTPRASEFRVDDCQKLFDLIESPQRKLQLLSRDAYGTRLDRLSQLTIDSLSEEVLATPNVQNRFDSCLQLATFLCRKKNRHDAMLLLDAMERMAENENNLNMFGKTLEFAKTYSLWDTEKTADWLTRYEAAIAQLPNVSHRFSTLREMLYFAQISWSDEATQNIWLDKLLATARDIPVPIYRLNALLEVAKTASGGRNPDFARAALDEAFAYAETIPEKDRRTNQVSKSLWELERLRDQLRNR